MRGRRSVERLMKHYRLVGPAAVLVALSIPLASHAADARVQRSGKQIVDETCIKCHGTGEQGAPRIGDQKAWGTRAKRGLSGLTQSAIKGIRNMPSHGGKLDLTDLELKRAITYMVNQSGGKWIEPLDKSVRSERSGRQIVEARCSKCHEEGKGGAPRIGDRTAWIPRLSQGFEKTVSSAIHGHGGMPARGGLPDLTDREVRAAIVYMLNPDPPAKK
jgi:cytochrome c5